MKSLNISNSLVMCTSQRCFVHDISVVGDAILVFVDYGTLPIAFTEQIFTICIIRSGVSPSKASA